MSYARPVRFEPGETLIACSICGFPYLFPSELSYCDDRLYRCQRTCMEQTKRSNDRQQIQSQKRRDNEASLPGASGLGWTVGIPAPPGSPVFRQYAADFNSTLTDGGSVTTWDNPGSLSDGDTTQAVAALRPTFRRVADAGNIYEMPAVQFDGADYMNTTAFASDVAQPCTYGIVFKTSTVATAQVLCAGDTDGINSQQIWLNDNHVALYANTHVSNVGLDVTANTWNKLVVFVSGASSYVRLNGVQSATINVGTAPQGAMYIMSKGGGAFPTTGFLAELTLWTDGTTPAQIETWIDAVYGEDWPQ